ncbi:hypothetical protein BH23BAC1_BH23BAC1_26950 [soil metagenome]
MSDFQEKLKKIKAIRSQRNAIDLQLYQAQLEQQKLEAQLRRQAQHQKSTFIKDENLAQLKEQLAKLEKQLQEVNKRLATLENNTDRLRGMESYIKFLEQKVGAIESRVGFLNRELQGITDETDAEERRTKIRSEIEALTNQYNQVQENLRIANKEREALISRENQVSREKENLSAKKRENQLSIQSIYADIKGIEDHQQVEDVSEQYKQRKADYERLKKELSALDSNLLASIDGIYLNLHPKDFLKEVSDQIPFMLFPVRIETRFIDVRAGRQLWLRIYPDDISVVTHEPVLTDLEVKEGNNYWKNLWLAGKEAEEEVQEDKKKEAWQEFSDLFGPQRAAWVARQTKPLNWDAVQGSDQESSIQYPEHDMTKTDAWTRAPRTRLLPDKFVVLLYNGNEIVQEVVGRTIPDILELGPDPSEADTAFKEEGGKLGFGGGFAWMSDFNKAVEVGMGFKIPLTAPYDTQGYSKILVLGLYLSCDDQQSKLEVEQLIENHHYSPKGFSIITQGTPTNNTEADGSGYTRNDSFSDISYFVETGAALFDTDDPADALCDGKRLAEALGIDYNPMLYIRNSDAKDYEEAVAMNKALYPGTLGYYFDTLMEPVINNQNAQLIKEFFNKNVTGRGLLPAIRVGNQPYGILLTSDFTQWKFSRYDYVNYAGNDHKVIDNFFQSLYKVLFYFQEEWDKLIPQLMYVGQKTKKPSEILLNILGLQPGSAEFFQRVAYSTEDLINRDEFLYGGKYFEDLLKNFYDSFPLSNFFNSMGYKATPGAKLPQLIKLIYRHYHTRLDSSNLVENRPLSENEKLKPYTADKNYIHWLFEATSDNQLRQQNFAGAPKPNSLLYMNLRNALLLQLGKSSSEYISDRDFQINTMKAKNFHNIRPEGDLTTWEVMKAKVGLFDTAHAYKELGVSDYLLGAGIFEARARAIQEVKDGLKVLAEMPTARLERCFTEHMDTCSYRLDAWQTGLFNSRLQQQRGTIGQDASDRRKGIHVGAYGWLEDVKPVQRKQVSLESLPESLRPEDGKPVFEFADNEGFIHAPSIDHASAASLLRSGYKNHATKENPEVMAVNLSSERVRRALFILDGMRNGQKLEALLGYQFERGLHDRSSENTTLDLNQHIYNFREKFPIRHNIISQKGSSDTPQESVPAYNIVNGLALAELTTGYPFGVPGIDGLNTSQKAAITVEKNRLSDSLDAIKDLLLSESAFQLVQGNFDRVGAVLNSMRDFHIPPDLDVIKTPRSSHLTYTNRVTIHFDHLDPLNPANNPWSPVPMTPRARIEPGLNKWISTLLIDPQNILCKAGYSITNEDETVTEHSANFTLAQLNLQPIDLVYIIGEEAGAGATELERRIAHLYQRNYIAPQNALIKVTFDVSGLAPGKQPLSKIMPLLKQLKSFITNARPLHAEDFSPPTKEGAAGNPNTKGFDLPDLQTRVELAQQQMATNVDAIFNLPFTATIAGTAVTKLSEAFTQLSEKKLDFIDVEDYTFTDLASQQLQNNLIKLADYGMTDAFPLAANGLADQEKLILLEQARFVTQRKAQDLVSSQELMDEAAAATETHSKVDKYVAAGKAVFAEAFYIMPLFSYTNAADISSSDGDRAQLLKYAKAATGLNMKFPEDEWLHSVSHVRPALLTLETLRTIAEANGQELSIKPVQLPYRAKDSWLAVEYPAIDELTNEPFQILRDTLSIMAVGNAPFNTGVKQSGFLVDEWTEVIPENKEITGISFHYNQPNATPPQAILLAVTPEQTGSWSWDDLVGTLNDTLQRAKRRAVEPMLLDKANHPVLSTLLPGVLSQFSQYDLDVSVDFSLNLQYMVTNTAPYMTYKT